MLQIYRLFRKPNPFNMRNTLHQNLLFYVWHTSWLLTDYYSMACCSCCGKQYVLKIVRFLTDDWDNWNSFFAIVGWLPILNWRLDLSAKRSKVNECILNAKRSKVKGQRSKILFCSESHPFLLISETVVGLIQCLVVFHWVQPLG